MLRQIRLTAWIVVAVVALLWGASAGGLFDALKRGDVKFPARASVGGPFRLTAHDGKPFDSQVLAGRPFAIFFGFTHCPEVCPTTLLEMSNHLQALGADANRLKVLFVSIDPERDTAEFLNSYLSSFDPRIVGLTGTVAEIGAIARQYRVYYEKVPGNGKDYTLNHTAAVYLMDAKGRFAGTLNYEEKETDQRAKLKRLLSR